MNRRDDFGDVAAEYMALREGAGLLDLSSRALLVLRGGDARRFLNNLVTNDVESLQDGQGCSALKVSLQGKVETPLRVLRAGDDLWIDLEPAPCEALADALGKRIILADVSLEDESARWALLALQGPRAAAVLAALGVEVGALTTLHAHAAATLAGIDVRVVRSDHTGDGGFDVFAPEARAPELWETLVAADGVRPVGHAAHTARRIEAGIPWVESELVPPRLPQEAGLDDGWISHTKGCYLGQETIARLHHMGHVNRELRGVVLESESPPTPGSTLRVGDRDAGTLTSSAYSPGRRGAVALAYVRREHAEPGTRVAVQSESSTMTGEVIGLPMP